MVAFVWEKEQTYAKYNPHKSNMYVSFYNILGTTPKKGKQKKGKMELIEKREEKKVSLMSTHDLLI